MSISLFNAALLSSTILIPVPQQAGSLFSSLFESIVSQSVIVTPLAGVPPSVDSLIQGLKQVDVDTLLLPAPFVDQIAKDSDTFAFIIASGVSTVCYGGADISTLAGDAFAAAGVLPVSCYGATETMTIPSIRPHEQPGAVIKDWQYVQPHPYANVHFEPTLSQPDLYELTIVRNSDPAQKQPVFTLLGRSAGGDEKNVRHRTRDLWEPHPHRPDLWRYYGRTDDVIVVKTGELIYPLRFEQMLEGASPHVGGAMMIGTDRWKTALLIEPAEQARHAAAADPRGFVLQRLWPVVEKANNTLSATARIVSPDHILLTSSEHSLPRAQKATVQRPAALAMCANEIHEMYERNGDGVMGSERPLPVHIDLEITKADKVVSNK